MFLLLLIRGGNMNSNLIETIEFPKGNPNKRVSFFYDDNAFPPWEEEYFGQLITFHSRYTIGTRHSYTNPNNFLTQLLSDQLDSEKLAEETIDQIYKNYNYKLRETHNAIVDMLEENYIFLPVFMLDHSGITISTCSFNDPWDSGQIGWIYISKKQAADELGLSGSELIKAAKDKMRSIVEYYDNYLCGNVFGFRFEELKPEPGPVRPLKKRKVSFIETDSCWGFIGDYDEVKESVLKDLGLAF